MKQKLKKVNKYFSFFNIFETKNKKVDKYKISFFKVQKSHSM